MRIETLGNHRSWIPDLALWQFEHWGRLTGFDTLEKYIALERWSAGRDLPTVLLATDDGELLGSVNLPVSDRRHRLECPVGHRDTGVRARGVRGRGTRLA